MNHRAFKGFGELMLPWEDNSRYFDTRLSQVGSLMPYHGSVDADVVVGRETPRQQESTGVSK